MQTPNSRASRLKIHKPQQLAALVAGVGLSLALLPAVAGASAKTEVLHFASYQQTFTYVTAAGKSLSQPPDNSGIDDIIQGTDKDYLGTIKHHAKVLEATDHSVCVFTNTTGGPTCYIQVAIGSSLILLDGVGSPGPTSSFTVYGGTGRFVGVTGSARGTNTNASGSQSNIVLTLHQ